MAKLTKIEKVKTNLSLPREIWKRAQILAIEEDTEVSTIVTKLLEQYLKARESKR